MHLVVRRAPLGLSLAVVATLLLMLLGCEQTPPESIGDCKDTPCRLSWLNNKLAQDPGAALAGLDTVPDQIERIALVSALTDTNPGKTAAFCGRLSRGASRDRCERVNSRPHLWSVAMETNSELPRSRVGGGPATSLLPSPAPSSSPYETLMAGPGPCGQRTDITACLQARAVRDAKRGDAQKAAMACAAISEKKWRYECMFAAAESIILDRGDPSYTTSVDLCTAAGDFASNCLSHTLIQLADAAPDATSTLAEEWAPITHTADLIRQVWLERDPELGALYEARYWSEVARLSYSRTRVVTGGPIDHLPAAALPYIRAAAAASLLRTQTTSSSSSLETLVNQLETALAQRSTTRAERQRGNWFEAPLDLWPEDISGDETMPAMVHFGTSRRTWAEDSRADLAICLMEAAAREAHLAYKQKNDAAMNAWLLLADQGRSWPDPRAQWTADRLRTRFAPGSLTGPGG